MKLFKVEIKRTQFLTVTLDAETLRQAIDKAEDPERAPWFPWDQIENATYEVIHVDEIPNDK